MRVIETEDGGFAFLFSAEEVRLGLNILNGLYGKNKESQESIEQAKFLLATLGHNGNQTVN